MREGAVSEGADVVVSWADVAAELAPVWGSVVGEFGDPLLGAHRSCADGGE